MFETFSRIIAKSAPWTPSTLQCLYLAVASAGVAYVVAICLATLATWATDLRLQTRVARQTFSPPLWLPLRIRLRNWRTMKNRATHYLYMMDPSGDNRRIVCCGVDYSAASLETRRRYIHDAMKEGYLTAKCPDWSTLTVGNQDIANFQSDLDSARYF